MPQKSTRVHKTDKSQKKSDNRTKMLVIAPTIVFLLLMGIFPLIYSVYLSVMDYSTVRAAQFRGLGNFVELFADMRFWNGVTVAGIFVVAAFSVEFLLGLGMALLLSRKIKWGRFFRVSYVLPMMLTPIAVGNVWRLIFGTGVGSHGPMNYMLSLIGLPAFEWSTSSATAMISLVIVDVWQWTPFMMLILLAGVQSIALEYYEEASVSGASAWQIFAHITMPMIIPVIIPAVLIRVIDLFKVFDIIYVVTGGGPSVSTESFSIYLYRVGFNSFRLGYASAASWVVNFMLVAIGLILIRFMARMR